MFREEYIKANEQIKPDEDFLKRLKESVAQRESVIHFGDYVDLDNTTSITDMKTTNDLVKSAKSIKTRTMWKNIVRVAACFAFVCTMAIVVGKMDVMKDNQGLQAGVESIIHEADGASATTEDTLLQDKYQKLYTLFDTMNVVLYEVESVDINKIGIEYLQNVKEEGNALGMSERDKLVGNILASHYTVKGSFEELDNAKCFVAEFEDDSWVCFAVDDSGYLYIAELSGIQSMAVR